VESRDLLESDKYIGNKGVRTLFHIKCKTGKSICLHSYSKQDKEILLLPATQFQVMNQEILTDNLFIIYLREIQPQYTLLQPPFDTDYSIVSLENDSYQNKCLQKFIEDHRMKNSICFSEQSLTIDDIHLITNELHSNKYWNEFSIHRICLNDVHIKDLMYALQSNLIVTYLYLKSNQLNDDTSSIIALALKTNTSLEKIDLTDNQITEIGAQSFANMLLINKTLLSLNLSSNIIGDKGMICLFRALQHNNTLCSLHLNQTKVTNQGIQELAIDLQPKTNLLRLYLNENNLGDEGMIAISHFLVENKQLNSLHLAMNNITFVGAEKIAMILQQSTNSLLELNLSENPLQDAGVIFIAQALIENTILIELHLDSVEMTIYGLEEITNMICINQTLKYLSLKKNEINDDGMVLLLNGLKYNRVLTHLHLNDNKLTDKCISNIVDKIMIRI
jgi:Ran GTPase-activating protein (RanGAP) involved in mRNA processing and transport